MFCVYVLCIYVLCICFLCVFHCSMHCCAFLCHFFAVMWHSCGKTLCNSSPATHVHCTCPPHHPSPHHPPQGTHSHGVAASLISSPHAMMTRETPPIPRDPLTHQSMWGVAYIVCVLYVVCVVCVVCVLYNPCCCVLFWCSCLPTNSTLHMQHKLLLSHTYLSSA